MKKTFLILLGIILSVLLLEAGLQLAAAAMKFSKHAQTKRALRARGEITILCIGESTTDNQWPRFLNQALIDAGVTKKVRVIDKGVGGTYTNAILKNIPSYIAQYNPDITVAMMGINDGDAYVSQARDTKLRTLKLFYMLRHHLQSPAKIHEEQDFQTERYPQTEIPGELSQKAELALELFSQKKLYEALDLFVDLLEEYDEHFLYLINRYVFLLPHLRFSAYRDKFVEFAEKALELRDHDIASNPILFTLYALETKNEKLIAEIIKKEPAWFINNIQEIREAFPDIYEQLFAEVLSTEAQKSHTLKLGFTAMHHFINGDYARADKYFNEITNFYMKNINPATQRNYLALADICKANNITLIAMQYPVRSVKPLKAMLAGRPEIIFVSNEENFKEALRNRAVEEIFTDLFAGDFGHATDLSNKLIAENLAKTLIGIIN